MLSAADARWRFGQRQQLGVDFWKLVASLIPVHRVGPSLSNCDGLFDAPSGLLLHWELPGYRNWQQPLSARHVVWCSSVYATILIAAFIAEVLLIINHGLTA